MGKMSLHIFKSWKASRVNHLHQSDNLWHDQHLSANILHCKKDKHWSGFRLWWEYERFLQIPIPHISYRGAASCSAWLATISFRPPFFGAAARESSLLQAFHWRGCSEYYVCENTICFVNKVDKLSEKLVLISPAGCGYQDTSTPAY